MNCKACDRQLTKVDDNIDTDYQFDNSLWIGFFGGYAMFVDNIEVELGEPRILKGADEEAVICHDCAHELCEKIPWIGKLLKPEKSHSHSSDFWEKNPDHEGWDNSNRERNFS